MLSEYARKRVVIYAAGADGCSLCRLLMKHGVVPEFFMDVNADKIGSVDGIHVHKPADVERGRDYTSYVVFIALSNQRFYRDALNTLRQIGFSDIRNGLDFLVELNRHFGCRVTEGDCGVDAARCLICQAQFYRCPVYERAIIKSSPIAEAEIVVPYVALIITTRCVHRCRDCHAAIPYLKPEDFDLNALLQDVSNFLTHVRCVYQLGIGSGEVFLHRHLPELLEILLNDGRIGSIHLTTTGAVRPSERLLQVLGHRKICISVSDYGNALGPEMNSRRLNFAATLGRRNKPFRYNKSLTWFDLGGHQERLRAQPEHQETFQSCEFKKNGNVIFDGKLYHCTRTYTHDRLGFIPVREGDYLDLRAGDHLKARMHKFYATTEISTCRFCEGTRTCKEIPAGIQLSNAS